MDTMLRSAGVGMWRILPAAILGVATVSVPRTAAAPAARVAPFQPEYRRCTLRIGGHTLTVAGVRRTWSPDYLVGTKEYSLVGGEAVGDAIQRLHVKTGQVIWSVQGPRKLILRWMAANKRTACFAAYRPATKNHGPRCETPLRLRRLDLLTKKWLPPLMMPAAKMPGKWRLRFLSVLAGQHRVAALTQRQTFDNKFQQWTAADYRLAVFNAAHTKPLWSWRSRSVAGPPGPGAYLLSSNQPAYASANVHYLSRLGKKIVLCAGQHDPVICFGPRGIIRWRIDNLWEFERGFIGPSMWTNYIGRFRSDDFRDPQRLLDHRRAAPLVKRRHTPARLKQEKAQIARLLKRRAAFNARHICTIIGGPIVVPDKGHRASIWVAVAKGPDAQFWGYCANCIVYQIKTTGYRMVDGHIITMAHLPAMVHAGRFSRRNKGLVWFCQHRGVVKLSDRDGNQNGFGASMLSHVSWYRQMRRTTEPHAWLTADPVGDLVAVDGPFALRTLNGGYVNREKSHVYNLPIALINLRTGMQAHGLLRVPFRGLLPKPTSHFSTDRGRITVAGPYKLAVTQLSVKEHILEITLGTRGHAAAVLFNLGAHPGGI